MNLISFSNLNTAEKLTCNHLLLLQRCIFKFFRPAFKSAERGSEFFERLLTLLLLDLKLQKLFFAFVNMQLFLLKPCINNILFSCEFPLSMYYTKSPELLYSVFKVRKILSDFARSIAHNYFSVKFDFPALVSPIPYALCKYPVKAK